MKINYKRNLRKWTALAVAIAAFLVIHEGSHLIYALSMGAFKQINILGLTSLFGVLVAVMKGIDPAVGGQDIGAMMILLLMAALMFLFVFLYRRQPENHTVDYGHQAQQTLRRVV